MAISISVGNPADGTWIGATPVLVNGTAETPGERVLSVDGTPGFANGTFNDSELDANESIRPRVSASTLVHYNDSFDYAEGTNIVDIKNEWSLSPGWTASSVMSSALSGAPSLVAGSPDGIVWSEVLPTPATEGRVSFRYTTQNATLGLRLLVDDHWSNGTDLLRAGPWTPEREFSANLTSLLSGRRNVTLYWTAGGNEVEHLVALDDLEITLGFSNASGDKNWSYAQPFEELSAMWEFLPDWQITNASPALNGFSFVRETPSVNPVTESNASFLVRAATNLSTVAMSVDIACQSQGRLRIYVSGGWQWSETLAYNSTIGVSATRVALNLSAMAASDGIRVRFWTTGTPGSGACAIDDFLLNLTMRADPPSFEKGAFTSQALDHSIVVNWTNVSYDADIPASASILLEVRGSANATNWTAWSPAGNASANPLAPARFLQFRIRLWGYVAPGLPSLRVVRVGSFAFVAARASLDNGSTWTNLSLSPGSSAATANWTGSLPLVPGPNRAWIQVFDTAGGRANTNLSLLLDAFPPEAPGQPSSASPYTNASSIFWQWQAAADLGLGVADYLVRVGTTPGGSQVVANLSVGNSTAYSFAPTADGVTYFLSVVARDGAGLFGPWSNSSSGVLVDRTNPPPTNPFRPSPWSNASTINWTWNASIDSGSGVSSYLVRLGSQQSGSDLSLVGEVNGTGFTFASAVDAQRYYLSIRPKDRAGNLGPWSQMSEVVIADLTPPTPPASVVGPEGYLASPVVSWSWSAGMDSGSGIEGYEFEVGTACGAGDMVARGATVLSSQPIGPLPEAVPAYFSVRSVDSAGNPSQWACAANPLIVDVTPPSTAAFVAQPPSWLSVGRLTWRWDGGSDANSGVAGYSVDLGSAPGATDILAGGFVTEPNYTVSTGQEGAAYFLRVRLQDRAGNLGAPALSSGSRIDLTVPDRPSAIHLPLSPTSNRSLVWSWENATDAGSGVAGYEVSVGMVFAGMDLLPWTFSAVPSIRWEGPAGGALLYFSVRSVDAVGWRSPPTSSPAGALLDTSPPDPVEVLPLPAYTNASTILAAWLPARDSGGAGLAGYELEWETGVTPDSIALGPSVLRFELAGPETGGYHVRIRGVDQAGNDGPWVSWAPVVFDRVPPGPISNLTWTNSAAGFELLWSPAADKGSGTSNYYVTVGIQPGWADVVDAARVNETSAIFPGRPGVRYFVSVAPVDLSECKQVLPDFSPFPEVDLEGPAQSHGN